MEQLVTEFPWHITPEYLENVNPTGYFRIWYDNKQGGSTVHQFGATLDLMSSETSVSTIGRPVGDITNDDLGKPQMNEEFWLLPEVSSLNLDSLKYFFYFKNYRWLF